MPEWSTAFANGAVDRPGAPAMLAEMAYRLARVAGVPRLARWSARRFGLMTAVHAVWATDDEVAEGRDSADTGVRMQAARPVRGRAQVLRRRAR